MATRTVKIVIIATFDDQEHENEEFKTVLTTEETGKDRPSMRRVARALGRAVSMCDRVNAETSGEIIQMTKDEIDASFVSNDFKVSGKSVEQPKKWLQRWLRL